MDEWAFLLEGTLASWRAAGSPGRVLAAVSGGADSMALLLTLEALARREQVRLEAVHVDHGLRPDAGEDAAFVAALCRDRGIPCRVMRVRVGGGGENDAREARYAALFQACAETGAQALALAHHRRDQAETMLLHLFRGSGGAGLGGMAESQARPLAGGGDVLLWRPFLSIPPDTLRAALMKAGVSWREDATNQSDAYLRNYLRHAVLPAVCARMPQAEEAMGRAARVLCQEADYFRREAERFLSSYACLSPPCRYVMGDALFALHPAVRRHVLRAACPMPLDFAGTEALLGLEPGQTANLPGGWRALRTARRLHFLPPVPDAPLPGRLEEAPARGETGDGRRVQALPRSVLAACELRFRREGDRIWPLGAPGEKSLQDYWVDKKIDRPFRGYLPLLCIGARVIWSVGVGPGEQARVTPGDEAVLLRYSGFLPGERPNAE